VEILPRSTSCRRCLAHDHITTACPSSAPKCNLCGELGHLRANCDATTPTCANCAGNHRPWDGRCPAKKRATPPVQASGYRVPRGAPQSTPGLGTQGASVSSSIGSTAFRSYSNAVINGPSSQSSSALVLPNQSPSSRHPVIGPDIAALGASILASSDFRTQLTQVVDQAVTNSLAAMVRYEVEGTLIRVLSSCGLIPPQHSAQLPLLTNQGAVTSSHQAQSLLQQPSAHSQHFTGPQASVQQFQGYHQAPVQQLQGYLQAPTLQHTTSFQQQSTPHVQSGAHGSQQTQPPSQHGSPTGSQPHQSSSH
jgi:hypothetical protein